MKPAFKDLFNKRFPEPQKGLNCLVVLLTGPIWFVAIVSSFVGAISLFRNFMGQNTASLSWSFVLILFGVLVFSLSLWAKKLIASRRTVATAINEVLHEDEHIVPAPTTENIVLDFSENIEHAEKVKSQSSQKS